MSDDTKIKAEARTEFGKGAARRIRRADKVPAVIYGHGNDPIHVTLPGHETMMAIKHGGTNALLDLEIEGKEQLALTKQIQVRPDQGVPRAHRLRRGAQGREGHRRRGHPPGRRGQARGAGRHREHHGPARGRGHHIPEYIEVSIEGAEVGTQFHASDLVLPTGSTAAQRRRPADRQRDPRARPPRRSRPSWRRPRPRPASSATSPTRRSPRPAEGDAAEGGSGDSESSAEE